MKRFSLLMFLALVASLGASLTIPGVAGPALAQPTKTHPQEWGSAIDGFWIEVRLDQVREKLLIDIGDSPNLTMVYLEVQTTIHDRSANQVTLQAFHAVYVDQNGAASIAVPLAASQDVIDYRIQAHAVLANGTIESSESWALLARPVAGVAELESDHPGLYDRFVQEMDLSRYALSDESPIGLDFAAEGFSQAFIPLGPHAPLEFSISGPGTIYSALPMSSMRLNSGPAGVFTAN